MRRGDTNMRRRAIQVPALIRATIGDRPRQQRSSASLQTRGSVEEVLAHLRRSWSHSTFATGNEQRLEPPRGVRFPPSDTGDKKFNSRKLPLKRSNVHGRAELARVTGATLVKLEV